MISFKLEPKIPSGEMIRGKMMYDYDFPYVNELIYFTCYKIRLKVKKIIPKSDKPSRKKNHIMQHIIFCIAKIIL